MTDLLSIKNLASELTLIYIEDDDFIRNTLVKYLSKLFNKVDSASNGEDGLKLYKQNFYDIVITDINMPKMNGLDMVEEIKKINEEQNILIISAYSETKYFTNFIKLGIDGYILKPIEYDQLNSILYKICFKIKKFKENEIYKDNLEEIVEEKTKSIKELQKEKVKNYQKTLYALIKMIEDRDTYTGGHSLRVANYSKLIAQHMGFDKEKVENIYKAGILHDIGKIAIPDNILLKPGSLEDLEYTIIKEHVTMGVKILNKIPMYDELTKFIEYHHERLDGSGYPHGAKGDEIPIESQILAVSDSFDAMTTNRIYKGRKTIKKALKEINELANIHFLKEVTDAACNVLKDIEIDDSISQLPITAFEKERFSYFYRDQVTHCYNEQYLDLVLLQNNKEYNYTYLYQIKIHNLNEYNVKYGWQEGNNLLKEISKKLQDMYDTDDIFRIFGDDFIILSKVPLEVNDTIILNNIDIKELNLEISKYNILSDKIKSLEDIQASNNRK